MAAQRAKNGQSARERMRVEHTIGSVKRCRIIKDTIRYWQDRVRSMVMEIAGGLQNLRVRFRPWHYDTDKSR